MSVRRASRAGGDAWVVGVRRSCPSREAAEDLERRINDAFPPPARPFTQPYVGHGSPVRPDRNGAWVVRFRVKVNGRARSHTARLRDKRQAERLRAAVIRRLDAGEVRLRVLNEMLPRKLEQEDYQWLKQARLSLRRLRATARGA